MYDLGPEFENARVEPGTNLLVSGPPLCGKRRLALEALAHGADDGEGAVVVTTRDSADRVLAEYRSLLSNPDGTSPGIVDCVTRHRGGSPRETDLVKYTSSPGDMTGIGIEFSGFLDAFYTGGVHQNRVVVDSLSTLLVYSDLETVFRFMHVLTSRIADTDAIGLHVLDSTAHDDEARNTLNQLFDGLVEVDENRQVSIRLPETA